MPALIEAALERPFAKLKPVAAPREFSRARALLLVAADVILMAGCLYLAAVLVFRRWDVLPQTRTLISSVVVIGIWLIIFARVGLYRRSFASSAKDELYYVVAALCLGVVPQLTLFSILPQISTSRLQLLYATLLSAVAVGAVRSVIRVGQTAAARRRPRRIAIVGNAQRIDLVQESLSVVSGTSFLRLDVDDIDATIDQAGVGYGKDLDSIPWLRAAQEWKCDTLLLTEVLPPQLMPRLLEIAGYHRITIAFAPPRIQCHAYSLTLRRDGQQALLVPGRLPACTPTALLLKRLFDLALASLGVAVTWPVMLAAAAAIWLESGGPILYRQVRVGRDGKRFELLKFRSMCKDAEAASGPVWATVSDNRTTRVGAFLRRTSIDELPQLFNVLRADMSIVGPRPERPVFADEFARRLPRFCERHLVRPGITGWSQVHLRRVLDPSDIALKLNYDLFYIEQWSLFMDVSVILKTAAEFLFHRAA